MGWGEIVGKFNCFIICAEMRTGSNFLETVLNGLEGIRCYGEAFNPHLIGTEKTPSLFGMDIAAREAEPFALLHKMIENTEGLAGFRFFSNHDPRILTWALQERACAKIILNRNPVDSYVSWKIALKTDQWILGDAKHRRKAKIIFDPVEFQDFIEARQMFQRDVLHRLQCSGQAAFFINYDDLGDMDVLNGLLKFLGVPARLRALSRALKKQNPEELCEKVENYDEMVRAVSAHDWFDLARLPDFEPRRGPGVRGFYITPKTPLLFLPIASGPNREVLDWMQRLDRCHPEDLRHDMSQKELRLWRLAHPGNRSFGVLRHPLLRAHVAFCQSVLNSEAPQFTPVRRILAEREGVVLPPVPEDEEDHYRAFCGFLRFLRANIAGQTGVRVDPSWASQSAILDGMVPVVLPDMLLREDALAIGLERLAADMGCERAPDYRPTPPTSLVDLHQIYNAELEKLARQAYRKDYIRFGFSDFKAQTPP